MGFIKILAKTYGNYFFVMQSVKVLKNMKKDDNARVGFGKVLLADKLMDVAQWLAKPDDKEKLEMKETSRNSTSSFLISSHMV